MISKQTWRLSTNIVIIIHLVDKAKLDKFFSRTSSLYLRKPLAGFLCPFSSLKLA